MTVPKCDRCRQPLDGKRMGCEGCSEWQVKIRTGLLVVTGPPEPEPDVEAQNAEIRRLQDAARSKVRVKPPMD